MSVTSDDLRQRRREANARLLGRGRELALEFGLDDVYGADSFEYERAKRDDPEYQRLYAEFLAVAAELRARREAS